jgi:AraC-like DNA-binding protein
VSIRDGRGRIVPGRAFRQVCQARELIEHDFAEPLSLEVLARQVGLSRFHLLRVFDQVYGRTPHRYLTETRLRRAKSLLRASDVSVTDVCMEVGFSSLGSFSALFTREVGQPPREFQRHLRRQFPVPASYRRPFIPICFVQQFSRSTP